MARVPAAGDRESRACAREPRSADRVRGHRARERIGAEPVIALTAREIFPDACDCAGQRFSRTGR